MKSEDYFITPDGKYVRTFKMECKPYDCSDLADTNFNNNKNEKMNTHKNSLKRLEHLVKHYEGQGESKVFSIQSDKKMNLDDVAIALFKLAINEAPKDYDTLNFDLDCGFEDRCDGMGSVSFIDEDANKSVTKHRETLKRFRRYVEFIHEYSKEKNHVYSTLVLYTFSDSVEFKKIAESL